MSTPRTRTVFLCCALASLRLTIPNAAGAQIVDPNLFATDGVVRAVERVGNTLYLGGDFGIVAAHTGGGVLVDNASGQRVPGFPFVHGQIHAAVPDGSGGWFVGGNMDSIGGLPCKYLAHVLSDMSVIPFTVGPDNSGSLTDVLCMALSAGTLYFGGTWIQSVNGQSRANLAAVDATTGALLPWNPFAFGTVRAMLIDGSTVYVGGSFDKVGGQDRTRLAAVDAVTGLATPWNPNLAPSATQLEVYALAMQGTTLYAGGIFSSINGQSRSHLAAFNTSTGDLTPWAPAGAHGVRCLALSASTIYAGGEFGIREFTLATGAATSFNPNPTPAFVVYALAVDGSILYAGGWFASIGGQSRGQVAAVSRSTGLATPWNPLLRDQPVSLVVPDGSNVLIGGYFSMANTATRPRLASFDLSTGRATAWNPAPNSPVYTIDSNGSALYVGGQFTTNAGQARNRVAAFDLSTGSLLSWNPNADGIVTTLDASGTPVYLGGSFLNVGGQPRSRLAAVDPVTGALAGWNPGANDDVWKVIAANGLIYVGGEFLFLGGQSRKLLGAVDPAGNTTAWDPLCLPSSTPVNVSPAVYAIHVAGPDVYAGGYIAALGGQTRHYLGAVSAATGQATPFNPDPGGVVYALTRRGPTLYFGGDFSSVGGQARPRVASADIPTGTLNPWKADVGGAVRSIDTVNGALYAGGSFALVTSAGAQYIAGISIPADVTGVEEVPHGTKAFALEPARPNPSPGPLTLAFVLPSAKPARIDVLDVSGRRVLSRAYAPAGAGRHVLALSDHLVPGVYVVRLTQESRSVTTRVVRTE